MTVCVATIFQWRYGENDYGSAVMAASDRMLTAGDIEYEPIQYNKLGVFTHRVVTLVSGEMGAHSQAVLETKRLLASDPTNDVGEIAHLYASRVRENAAKTAEHIFLSPLGLTRDTFIERQGDMDATLVSDLTYQLLHHHADVEAIICGCDDGGGHLYHVDARGVVTCQTDVGFVAIGSGAWHANSHLMTVKYSRQRLFADSLYQTYSAKRRAEVAPGVGTGTDMIYINRLGGMPVADSLLDAMHEVYDQKSDEKRALDDRAIDDIYQRWEKTLDEKTDEKTPSQDKEPKPESGGKP